MPYTIRKKNKKDCYTVYNKKTKRVFSKCTSKRKAQKQLRLLNYINNKKNKKILKKYFTRKRKN